jgi:uncharacterized RDD family membrane protein YckC
VAEVVTGEAVVLDVPIASFPGRLAALLVDVIVQITLSVVILAIVLPNAGYLDPATVAAISLSCWVLIIVGYPTIFETLSRGKTLGKLALGQRVVSDDGSPERFRQALVRALAGVLEVWLIIGAPAGLICCMLSARGKRLGDLLAGTFAIQERVPRRPDLPAAFAVVPPPLAEWARGLELSRLSDQTANAASSYLRRFVDLRPAARDELGRQLATAVAAQVSPPPPAGTPAAAYLAAVLAVRRDREQARLAVPRPVPPAFAGQVPSPVTGAWPGRPAGGEGAGDQPGHGGAGAGTEPRAGGFVPPA